MLKFLLILLIIILVVTAVVSFAIKGLQRYLAKRFFGNASQFDKRSYHYSESPKRSDNVIYDNGETIVMKGEAGKNKKKSDKDRNEE